MIEDLKEAIISNEEIIKGYIILLNGIHVQFKGGLEAKLRDGDEVSIFPPGAGG